MQVRAKKHLGQHFLTDKHIAKRIVDSLKGNENYTIVLEIGPGKGILTDWLIQLPNRILFALDIDKESILYLHQKYPTLEDKIIEADVLTFNFSSLFTGNFAVIGNFPYNISSQILFKVLEMKDQVPEVVGMFQKEVAQRICASPSNKEYGILSVLIQAFYKTNYLFTVNAGSFFPPPKVKSGVLRLERHENYHLNCDEKLFFQLVKAGFNQRRKTLRNALSAIAIGGSEFPFSDRRAESLNVAEFVELTLYFQSIKAVKL